MGKVKFRKGYSQRGNLYWVDVIDGDASISAGHVIKSVVDGKWGNSKDEERYATRKAAVEALMPYVAAELAAVRHYANATSEDAEVSHYLSETYQNSYWRLIRAIEETYPDMDSKAVYDEWVRNGETVAYNVDLIRREIEDLHEYALELNAMDTYFQMGRKDAESTDSIKFTVNMVNLNASLARTGKPPISAETVSAAGMVPVTTPDTNPAQPVEMPQERIAAFLVVDYTDNPNTRVVMGVISPDLPADKATGHTKAGVPFSVVTMDYTNSGAAWRMVDVTADELRNHVKPFKVVIEGVRPDVTYAGTVYTSAHAARVDEPTYRAAGFPSLDAAIGASYAHS